MAIPVWLFAARSFPQLRINFSQEEVATRESHHKGKHQIHLSIAPLSCSLSSSTSTSSSISSPLRLIWRAFSSFLFYFGVSNDSFASEGAFHICLCRLLLFLLCPFQLFSSSASLSFPQKLFAVSHSLLLPLYY